MFYLMPHHSYVLNNFQTWGKLTIPIWPPTPKLLVYIFRFFLKLIIWILLFKTFFRIKFVFRYQPTHGGNYFKKTYLGTPLPHPPCDINTISCIIKISDVVDRWFLSSCDNEYFLLYLSVRYRIFDRTHSALR